MGAVDGTVGVLMARWESGVEPPYSEMIAIDRSGRVAGLQRKDGAEAPHSMLAALDAAAFVGPVKEAFELIAVFPA